MFREELVRRLESMINTEEVVPRVHFMGSIGAGKSSLLHGIHKTLRYSNAGIRIESKRAHSAKQLSMQRIDNACRANSTIEPEKMPLYISCPEGIRTLELCAEGSHSTAHPLWDPEDVYLRSKKKEPHILVFALDLSFIDYLFKQGIIFEPGQTETSFQRNCLDGAGIFKDDYDIDVYSSLLRSIRKASAASYFRIPLITALTNYRVLERDSQVLSLLSSGALFSSVDRFIALKTDLDEFNKGRLELTIGRRPLLPLQELVQDPILVDSRIREPYGVEEVAYRIASAVISSRPLRLVSFSHHVPETERVTKFLTLNAP